MNDDDDRRRDPESEIAILYRLDERTERIDDRIGRVDKRIDGLDEAIERHDGRLDEQQRQIDRNSVIINALTFGLGTAVATVIAKFQNLFRFF